MQIDAQNSLSTSTIPTSSSRFDYYLISVAIRSGGKARLGIRTASLDYHRR